MINISIIWLQLNINLTLFLCKNQLVFISFIENKQERTLKNLCTGLHTSIQKKYQFINKIFLFQKEQEITKKELITSSFIFCFISSNYFGYSQNSQSYDINSLPFVNDLISKKLLINFYLLAYHNVLNLLMNNNFINKSLINEKRIIKIYPLYQQNYGLCTILKKYSKLQTQQFKTALKILYEKSSSEFSCNFMRNEFVIFINTFGNILSSYMICCMSKAHYIILILILQIAII
ncbi:unnamed protein product [Paramecium primaurelia]|uniref:Transmembrane protein n=1 Tax=Paramecium primaurelia TaxID=5886 RepID=A0A8S1KQZ9_PARPR|nr:unnamed protein product [Paramecium primaurelia]